MTELARWMLLAALAAAPQAEPNDLLIRGGRIVDGTGAPWYAADVAVRGGRIAAIGRLEDAPSKRTIDARGLVVAPGFIDMMGQTAAPFLKDPAAGTNLLAQGITTILAGEGASDAPLGGKAAEVAGWGTMAEFFAVLEKRGLPMNVVQTVGHTQVRRLVIGDVDRQASPGELERMKALVREAMDAGAIGLSTALIYPPAVYASTEEIAALARVAGERGGRYYTHMRNEGDRLLEAIDEALGIGAAAGTPVHIFHLKTAGEANWGKMAQALARIRAARAAGQEVDADVYPYVNNGLGIRAFIHPRHAAEGTAALLVALEDLEARARIREEMERETGWENWFRHAGRDWDRVVIGPVTSGKYAGQGGKTLAAVAAARGADPWEVFFDLCRAGVFVMPQTMSEANKIAAMREDFVSFCTDAGPAGESGIASHPRAYGAFPRILARYVRDLGALSLERAVAKMSSLAANQVYAYDRGRLAVGLAADVAVFDAGTIADRATFAKPDQLAVGMRWVIVNGAVVFEDGKFAGASPGRVLRGPGHRKP